jgi:hypothetical protein
MSQCDSLSLEWLEGLRGLEIVVAEVDFVEERGHSRQRLVYRVPQVALMNSALGMIFALGALSFEAATPRGASVIDYDERDEWTPTDMLRGLTYDGGDLRFDADYVRGRMMKTRVRVRSDGAVIVSTINRGRDAERWIDALRGVPRLIETDDDRPTA